MNAWFALLSSLLGVGVGGLLVNITSKWQFERQRNWQRDQFLQEKLADIAKLADDVQQACRKLYMNAILTVEGSQALGADQQPIPLSRLNTLIRFYAPELHDHMKVVMQVRDSVGDIVAEVITGRPFDTGKRQQLNLQLVRGVEQMDQACDKLSAAAAQLARHRLGIESLK
jgi:hypothetical protein